MDQKERQRTQLECLYDMFRDRVEENVIYIVYTENEGLIEQTIDQLMSISACSLTGYYFEPPKSLVHDSRFDATSGPAATTINAARQGSSSPSSSEIDKIAPSSTCSDDDFKLVRKPKRSHKRKTTRSHNDASKDNTTQANGDTDSGVGSAESNERESLNDEDELGDQEDSEQARLDEQIESLQVAIENLLTEKGACHEKATHYLSKKMFPVTSYYSELASQYRRAVEVKTRKLVDLLLTKSANSYTIDLHGLNPIQAKLVVTDLLNNRQDKLPIDKQGEASLDIITGWGKHTVVEGNHRIRPTIVALLREKGYEFYHLNKGALRVTIRR